MALILDCSSSQCRFQTSRSISVSRDRRRPAGRITNGSDRAQCKHPPATDRWIRSPVAIGIDPCCAATAAAAVGLRRERGSYPPPAYDCAGRSASANQWGDPFRPRLSPRRRGQDATGPRLGDRSGWPMASQVGLSCVGSSVESKGTAVTVQQLFTLALTPSVLLIPSLSAPRARVAIGIRAINRDMAGRSFRPRSSMESFGFDLGI